MASKRLGEVGCQARTGGTKDCGRVRLGESLARLWFVLLVG